MTFAEGGVLLSEALGRYYSQLDDSKRLLVRQDLSHFTRWCGTQRKTSSLTAQEMAEYAQLVSNSVKYSTSRLQAVKDFLKFLWQTSLIQSSLSTYIKMVKVRRKTRAVFPGVANIPEERPRLTAEGYQEIQGKLESLKDERVNISLEIQRAAADKDFRENAPLDAAREHQGMVEARIRELEVTVANAVVMRARASNDQDDVASRIHVKIQLGCKVTLRGLVTDRSVDYILVDAREADPAAGKISVASPVGQALLDRSAGEEITVTVPGGIVRYTIEAIER